MSISSNMGIPPQGGQAYVDRANHTGAAQRQSAAARGDATGTKEQQSARPSDSAEVGAGATAAPPPEPEEGRPWQSQGVKNGVEHFTDPNDGSAHLFQAANGVQLQREQGVMLVGFPDGTLIERRDADGSVRGQRGSEKIDVQADESTKTLLFQDARGVNVRIKPEDLSFTLNDQIRVQADGSQIDLRGQQQFVQQPPQQAPGTINPHLGVGDAGGASPGQAAMSGAAGVGQERTEQTPSGLMRTITADGMMVIGLPNGVAISHGPAGAMAMDARSDQPIPVQTQIRRRPDGQEEYQYTFNDAGGNRYNLFSSSMDFSVEGADGRSCQLVLPQGNVLSAVRGQDNQWYTHEAMPDGSQINRGGAQFAGDRVIMPNGAGVAPLPFPVSGYMPPGMQEAAARQGARPPGQPGPQNGPQGGPQFGANPGGGIPGTPDNPMGGGHHGPNPAGMDPHNMHSSGDWSPHPSLHPREGFPQAEVRPGIWQRFKNFISGRPSNYMPPSRPWSQPNRFGGDFGQQGPWGPPPYADYHQGMPPGPRPGGWGSEQYPMQQSNNWMKWMLGAQVVSSGLTGLMLLSTVSMASPWNMSFFGPMGGGFF